MMIVFDIPGEPPRTTAQQARSGTGKNGRHYHYKTDKIKEAEAYLIAGMLPHRPKKPMTGAIQLYVVWYYDAGKKHKDFEPKLTRPDTDNLQKLLKDCMTKCGFWKDDAQVYMENACKAWSREPGIYVEVREKSVEDDTNVLKKAHEEAIKCLQDCANCIVEEDDDNG